MNKLTNRLVALQHRDFRLLWASILFGATAMQMQVIAVNWHIYTLLRDTESTLSIFGWQINLHAGALGLGVLGLVRVIPLIGFGLLGGMLADSFDRRRLLLVIQVLSALLAGALAVLALTGAASVGAVYLLTGAASAALAVEGPAREPLVSNLVPRRHLTNAISLDMLVRVTGTIVGPAVAGAVLEVASVGVVYGITAVGFVLAGLMLVGIRTADRPHGSSATFSLAALAEGFRFTYQRKIIWRTMMLDFFATFMASARTMLPIVADELLGVGPGGYGLLATAQPVGSILAGSFLSLRREIRRQGLVLLSSIAAYATATVLFGLSPLFVLSYLVWAVSGAADTTSSIVRGTIRQTLTPDRLRGRMMGVSTIFMMGGPQLGEVRAGLVAALFGAPVAIVSGGLITLGLTGWVAWRYPNLRQYTSAGEQAGPGDGTAPATAPVPDP